VTILTRNADRDDDGSHQSCEGRDYSENHLETATVSSLTRRTDTADNKGSSLAMTSSLPYPTEAAQ
jgi:hypothetical protein